MDTNTYELIVGLEVHAQLSTESKMFCSDETKFLVQPNSQVSAITLGLPGTLPATNFQAIDKAIMMGIALNCNISKESVFARKNYFYPDLPKGYQISQSDRPLCTSGYLNIKTEDKHLTKIRIERIHVEEDAGKSFHDQDFNDTLIDFNRAGIPLIEIVTQPDIKSTKQAHQFLFEIRKILRFLEVGDGNMEEGNLRCDVNVSVRKKGETKLNNRCEVKNLNSFRYIQQAIDYEFHRQIKVMEAGKTVASNTLLFDIENKCTRVLRTKEMANDYRYFNEPDLPPLYISQQWIDKVREKMTILPQRLYEKLTQEFSLNDYDANQIINDKTTATYFMQAIEFSSNYKAIANWILGPIRSYINEFALSSISRFPLSPKNIALLSDLVHSGKIPFSKASTSLFPLMIKSPQSDPLTLAQEANLLLEEVDTAGLDESIVKVLQKYPDKVQAYQKGKKGLLGFFMGLLIKQYQGKINPKVLQEHLSKQLD